MVQRSGVRFGGAGATVLMVAGAETSYQVLNEGVWSVPWLVPALVAAGFTVALDRRLNPAPAVQIATPTRGPQGLVQMLHGRAQWPRGLSGSVARSFAVRREPGAEMPRATRPGPRPELSARASGRSGSGEHHPVAVGVGELQDSCATAGLWAVVLDGDLSRMGSSAVEIGLVEHH